MKLGDIVVIHGEKRMITRIDGDKYFSVPTTIDEPQIETIKVPEKVVKRKKK